jgi:AraC-like DNA-binding protein
VRNVVKKIKLGDINPFVRLIRIHTIKKAFNTGIRYNHHYQLHYVFNGIGHFHINGRDYTAKKGELCLWRPGQAHSIASSHSNSVTVAGVQFDFTHNFSHLDYLLVPYNSMSFDEKHINEIIEFTDTEGFPPYIRLNNCMAAEEILKTAEKYFQCDGIYGKEKASAKLKEFFILLAEELITKTSNKKHHTKNHKLLEHIKKNFRNDMSNYELAVEFGYHPVHLNRIVLDLTGMSLHQYIIKLRIDEALHLLQNTNLQIRQVAEKVGYDNPQYFSRLFKSKTGHPPIYFRV